MYLYFEIFGHAEYISPVHQQESLRLFAEILIEGNLPSDLLQIVSASFSPIWHA